VSRDSHADAQGQSVLALLEVTVAEGLLVSAGTPNSGLTTPPGACASETPTRASAR
jgi:hypothetical protein